MFALGEGRAIGKALRMACRLSSVRYFAGCSVVEAVKSHPGDSRWLDRWF